METKKKSNIRELREHLGLTQEIFAQILGTSFQLLSKWEGGKVKPSHKYLLKICDEFGASADWIFYGEGPMFRKDLPVRKGGGMLEDSKTKVGFLCLTESPCQDLRTLKIPLRESWMSANFAQKENVLLARVPDNTMSPLLQFDDLIIIDPSVKEIVENDRIYVYKANGTWFVRKIVKRSDGKWWVYSTNKDIPGEDYPGGDKLQMKGMVVGYVRSFKWRKI